MSLVWYISVACPNDTQYQVVSGYSVTSCDVLYFGNDENRAIAIAEEEYALLSQHNEVELHIDL